MRVVYPFVTDYPEAVEALPREAERVALGPADDAYWRLFRDLWSSGEDFIIIEQDMIVPSGAIARLASCRREWCGHPYYLYGNWGCWHGVVRYRALLTRRLPTLPDEIRARGWKSLDSAWINHLRLHDVNEAHWHWPPARHLNPVHRQREGDLNAGRHLAELTSDGPLRPYRESLRLTPTDVTL